MFEIELDHHRGGSGEPLLLVHGIGLTWRLWKPVLAALEERHEVLAVDLPGFGRSAPLPPGTPSTPESLADALERALEAWGRETVHVAGNSLGGWLALELALRGRARTVVAFSPAGLWSPKERDYAYRALLAQRAMAQRIAPAARSLSRSTVLRSIAFAGAMSRPWRLDPAQAAETLELYAGAPAFRETLETKIRQQPRGLDSIRTPTLIAWGERDRLLLPRQARRFASLIPGAELRMLVGLGHVPMSDDPDAVARTILEFTARAGAGAPVPAGGLA